MSDIFVVQLVVNGQRKPEMALFTNEAEADAFVVSMNNARDESFARWFTFMQLSTHLPYYAKYRVRVFDSVQEYDDAFRWGDNAGE